MYPSRFHVYHSSHNGKVKIERHIFTQTETKHQLSFFSKKKKNKRIYNFGGMVTAILLEAKIICMMETIFMMKYVFRSSST
jgi:hypothetical protein